MRLIALNKNACHSCLCLCDVWYVCRHHVLPYHNIVDLKHIENDVNFRRMRWVHPHTIRCAFICTASSQCRLDMSCHSHGNKVMFRHFCLFFFFIPFVHQFGSSLWLAWHSFHWRHTTHLWRGVCIMYICDAVESTPEVEKRAAFVYKCTMANAVTPFRITKVSMKLISMAIGRCLPTAAQLHKIYREWIISPFWIAFSLSVFAIWNGKPQTF